MTKAEIEETVKKFLVEELEIDESKIAMDARMKEDMEIDSLDFVDIVVIVDKKFGFKIQPEEMKGIVTLNDFCNYIDGKLNKN